MEKSLLMLLREEDERVAEYNAIKSRMAFWDNASDEAFSDGDEDMARRYLHYVEISVRALAKVENKLADTRKEMRKHFREILKAETA